MVNVVTNAQEEQQVTDTAIDAENTATEEMAQQAREAAVQDDTAEVVAPSSEEKEWDDLLNEDEDVVLDEIPAEDTRPEDVVTPVEEVPAVKTVEEVPAAEVVKPEEVVKPAEEVVAPVTEAADTRTPEEVQLAITEARDTAREKLVETYKMTDEQAEQFAEDPSTALSEMAADIFLDLYDSISQGFRAQMPGMVNGIMQQQRAQVAHEQQFYGAWPDLAKAEYKPTIDRITEMYHQQNPGVDAKTATEEIGAQAWVALRLPIEQLVARAQVPPVDDVVVPIKPSHVPASAGNTVQAARAPVANTGNEYEQLASEILLDDE